jgi:hypothetical protein
VVGLPRSFPYYFTTVGDRYQDPAVDVPGRSEPDRLVPLARGQVAAARERLRRVDPPALADEEGYWSVVIEQMGYGHL